MSSKSYIIRYADKTDYKSIVDLLLAYFIPEATLVQSYIIRHQHQFQEDATVTAEASLRKSIEGLLQSYCAVIVTVHEPTKEIVGVVGIESPKNTSIKAEIAAEERALKVKWAYAINDVMHHLWTVSRTANYYKRKREMEKKVVLLNFLTVHKDHRGHELSTKMLKKAIEWAQENNYELPQGVFTSTYSKKAAMRAGMTTIYQRDLRTIKNMAGDAMFEDMTPNNEIAVMEYDWKAGEIIDTTK